MQLKTIKATLAIALLMLTLFASIKASKMNLEELKETSKNLYNEIGYDKKIITEVKWADLTIEVKEKQEPELQIGKSMKGKERETFNSKFKQFYTSAQKNEITRITFENNEDLLDTIEKSVKSVTGKQILFESEKLNHHKNDGSTEITNLRTKNKDPNLKTLYFINYPVFQKHILTKKNFFLKIINKEKLRLYWSFLRNIS